MCRTTFKMKCLSLFIIVFLVFFNSYLFAEQKKCKNLCKVKNYLRQKCTNDCLTDKTQSEKFKTSCLGIGGKWSFTLNEQGFIDGFQCELIKEKNINISKVTGDLIDQCNSLNLGTKDNEIQIVSVPLSKGTCNNKLSKLN